MQDNDRSCEVKNYIEKVKSDLIDKEHFLELYNIDSNVITLMRKEGHIIYLCSILDCHEHGMRDIGIILTDYEKGLIKFMGELEFSSKKEVIRGNLLLIFSGYEPSPVRRDFAVKNIKNRIHLLPLIVVLERGKIFSTEDQLTYIPEYPPGRHFFNERLPIIEIDEEKKEEITFLLNKEFKEIDKMERFREAMNKTRPYVTWILLALNIFIWFVMEGAGGTENVNVLTVFGVNERIAIWKGEYWRLFSSMFIHIGLLHLAGNCLFLYLCGPLLELSYGHEKFLIIYILSGFLGNILSLLGMKYSVTGISAGASGALFGILGALISFTITERTVLPQKLYRSLIKNLILIVVLNLLVGLVIPNIDILAHTGGFVSGLILGYILENEIYIDEKKKRFKVIPSITGIIFFLLALTVSYMAMIPPDNMSYYTGNNYLREEQYEDAEKEFTKAIAVDPNNSDIYMKLAIACLGQNKIDMALERVEYSLKLDPENILANYLTGTIYQQKGDLGKALFYYGKSIEIDKKFALGYQGSGDIYRLQKKWDLALENSRKAIEMNSLLPSAHSSLGWIYLYQQNIEEAEKQFDRALNISSRTDIKALIGTAGIYMYRGDFQGALTEAEKIKKLKSQSYLGYMIESDIYRTEGKYDKSVASALIAVEKEPSDYYTHFYLARSYLSYGRNKEAFTSIQKSIELDCNEPSAWELMAFLYYRLDLMKELISKEPVENNKMYHLFLANCYYYNKDFSGAEEELEKLLALDPVIVEAYLLKTGIFYNRGDINKAEETINKAKAIDPYDDRITYRNAFILLQNGKKEEAVKEFGSLKDMSNSLTYYGKAFLLYLNNDFDGAIKQVDTALKIYKEDPEGHLLLAMIAEDKGETVKACEEYKTVLLYDPNRIDAKKKLEELAAGGN
ncbi:MAG: rhomboid family intramembrane serine protease [Candidatus Eremiobacterota bacterium]